MGTSRNKYQRLTDHFLQSEKSIEHLTYNEIKDILGFDLPYSAYQHQPWWANSGHSHARIWTDAGGGLTQLIWANLLPLGRNNAGHSKRLIDRLNRHLDCRPKS